MSISIMTVDEGTRRIGTTLRDKWVLEELLGVGGMASVYAARHKIGRRDAIKILHPQVASSEQLRARFEQEAHAVNAFKHPGVVEIRDVDTAEDGAPFLVMELLEGESLAQRLAREKSLEPREVLEIAAQVLDVLAAAHARSIIHRDIKPDNVFLSKDGRVKVLDFGIARVRSADKKALTTKAGVTLGTMAYMAPEQARGEEIDGRADVYAVGATAFRALAGRFVHDETSQAALVMRVIAHGAPRLETVMPGIDPSIAAVVDRALAFDASDRYPDAATMLADVRAVLEGKPPPYATTAPPIPERPSISSLFDETPSEDKVKPTVVPPARRVATPPTQASAEAAAPPAGDRPMATIVGGSALPAEAYPSLEPAAITRVSPPNVLPTSASSGSPSERVVIVPSKRGAAIRPAEAAEVATVHGLAPPPDLVAQPSRARPGARTVLTPFGELSAFVRSNPTGLVLVVGGAATFFAIVLLVGVIIWFVGSSSSARRDEAQTAPGVEATPAVTATSTQTNPSPLPPPRTRSPRR